MGKKICEKLLCRHRVSEVGGGHGDARVRAEIFLQSLRRTVVTQAVTLQPMEGLTLKQVNVSWTQQQSMESPWWGEFSGRIGGPKGDACWSSWLLQDCTQWKGLTP